jgi:Escherichia/Staphylococcus phage prohead protease
MKIEKRALADAVALDQASPGRLTGYIAKFNSQSEVMFDPEVCSGPFVEIIAVGAFTRTLSGSPDIRALYNHDTSAVLGRTNAGTLTLREDEVGLAFDLTLPDTQVARDLRASVQCGNVDGCSFGFFVVEDRVELRPGLPALRTLIEVDVFEVTPGTAFPAYGSTTLALRSTKRTELTPPAPAAGLPCLNHALAMFRLLAD